MNCCSPSGYRKTFGERVARRDALRYRRKGLPAPAGWIVETVVGRGVKDANVLEVGGGVGAIQLELLKAGASHTVNVEFSPGYEAAAAELVGEAGLDGRVEREIGDFTQDGPFDVADVVVMHRVVCCYPDFERLLTEAASRARRTLVFSYPPRNLASRLVNGGSNLWMRLRRNSFRSYVHSPETMIEVASSQGLEPVAWRRGGFWRAVALARD